jgi:hypothetical protein
MSPVQLTAPVPTREAHDVAAGPVENAAVVAVDHRDVPPGILHVHPDDVRAQELVGVRPVFLDT